MGSQGSPAGRSGNSSVELTLALPQHLDLVVDQRHHRRGLHQLHPTVQDEIHPVPQGVLDVLGVDEGLALARSWPRW